ncbi:MAG: type IX secretion system outer membrane channel protein PorV [Chitinophagales bacterium]|nr:type IX secretion system outer membrane channel protein PorV [Chitinophagales bacterium]HAE14840.1 hypothetical protein [Bacteroidota bacterium]MCB9020220.1 type IX secretion system outer membrane channel protein PorV [Chitinophagales bacterium]MCB9020999.1 type IX secretion system outer membrane channel protein PorV [Chitinophagales bacterium]HPE98581.1 type IX secretion system outer membrane channel protein PorV [Chitinophagales bacterium]
MKNALKCLPVVALLILAGNLQAQVTVPTSADGEDYLNTVTTAVPFLRIAPDARGGSMGDVGIATSPDGASIFWNNAKFAFHEENSGLAITYTPWLSNLVNDIFLAYLNGFWRTDELSVVSGSLRYFSLGNITFTDQNGQVLQDFRPNEFALDFGYARKLSDNFSTGLVLKYIYSNLASGQFVNGIPIKPANGVAADISVFYTGEVEMGSKDAFINAGANIANLGNKVTYTSSTERDFIPTNLGVGASIGVNFDEYNKLAWSIDFNKLLVPTPDTTDIDPANGIPDYKELSPVSGVFSSFSDAPNGFSEELNEITIGTGLEYWYNNQFAVRGGFFFEDPTKGGRQFFTLGLGLKYNVFGLDFSYLIPSSNQQNPLDNTLRFTLSFDFEALASDAEPAE